MKKLILGITSTLFTNNKGCDLTKVTNPEKRVAAWVSLGLEDKAPLNLLDVQFWRIYRLSTSPQTRN